ncbi:unnamed protein product [Closterium sp. NIES-53]
MGGSGRFWAVLGGPGRFLTVLGGSGQLWMVLEGSGWFWAVLSGPGRFWADLGIAGGAGAGGTRGNGAAGVGGVGAGGTGAGGAGFAGTVGNAHTSGMGVVLRGRGRVLLTGHCGASWADYQETQWSCESQIYAWVMAQQELCWLTYLLTDLIEWPCSPLVMYVDNKAMIAMCREQRPEHRKHIALRYFLARELQQRGQLCLAYVALKANTADIFTKALGCGDQQCFCTALGLVPTLPHLLVS